MKKVLLYFMLMLLPSCVMAQNSRGRVNPSIYLTGAVPVVNGYVQFDKTYYVKNKSKAALMDSLRNYVQRANDALSHQIAHQPHGKRVDNRNAHGVFANLYA